MSIQELDETELEHRFSRYKSNQKITTLKHIATANPARRGQRATRQKHQKRPMKQSFMENVSHGNRVVKKRKRQPPQNRQGNFVKKGAPRKQL